jgi:hypothetical protein
MIARHDGGLLSVYGLFCVKSAKKVEVVEVVEIILVA